MVKLEKQKHDRVQRAERFVEMMMRFDESQRVRRLLQGEADEQSSEQQDFRGQEQPHPDLARIELLLKRREVVLQPRVVPGVMFAVLIHGDRIRD